MSKDTKSKALKKLIDINRLREFKNKLVGAGSAYVQTTAVDQTIAGTKTFSKPIVGSVTGSSGSCTGNAATATKATQDAAGNTITTTYATKAENNTKANDSDVVHKSGDETINGFKTFTSEIVCTSKHTFRHIFGEYGVFWRHDGTNLWLMLTNSGDQYGSYNNFRPLVVNLATGKCSINGNANSAGSAGSATNATYANWLRTSSHSDHLFHTEWDNAGYFWTYVTAGDGSYRAVRVARSDSAATAEACTGNAATATKLQTARTINGTAFNGTANITTANWGTARNIAIADATATNTGKAVSVNGSAAVTLKLPAAIKANVTGSLTGNAATATKATQDSDGHQINTTYSKNGHTHDDRYYTETEVNNLLNGKANTSGTYSNLTVGNAGSATNATYANWLRASSHTDHLFHTEWDNAGYFWTYVTAGNGEYRAVRVARSDSSGNADTATKATYDSAGNQINTTYIKRTDVLSYNIGACFIGFYSLASHITNIGNGGRLTVGSTTSASNLYDTITTASSNTVVCSRNITLAGVWKLISIIKHSVFSENYASVESTHQPGSSFASGVVATQGLFVRVS